MMQIKQLLETQLMRIILFIVEFRGKSPLTQRFLNSPPQPDIQKTKMGTVVIQESPLHFSQSYYICMELIISRIN